MTQLSAALQKARKNRGDWSYRTIEGKMQDAGHDVSFSTIGVYLRGEHGKPEERVLAAFAAVFPELSITELRRLAKLPTGELGPWQPPAEASRLNQDQRDALNRLIRTIVGSGSAMPAKARGAASPVVDFSDGPPTKLMVAGEPILLSDIADRLSMNGDATLAHAVRLIIEAKGDWAAILEQPDDLDLAARTTGQRTKGQRAREKQDLDAER